MATTNEQTTTRTDQEQEEEEEKEAVYKTKNIQFLGRTTPIVLQNDNGPCPLLAICNVLSLKNNFNLSSDISEVSQQRLLALVADRLLESNSNTENKDAGYVENQHQNIADAIDMLSRLATGIDVNVQFRKIDDFEFTRECAIFDLLDIPLYHGWIVDPQDSDTANAIGSKSYNTLMGELVALEASNTEEMHKINSEEDAVDFVAATTATLGVPSPSLSRVRSFEDSESGDQRERKGDKEEEARLLQALELSNNETTTTVDESSVGETHRNDLSVPLEGSTHLKSVETGVHLDKLEAYPVGHQEFLQPEQSQTLETIDSGNCNSDRQCPETSSLENNYSSSEASSGSCLDQASSIGPAERLDQNGHFSAELTQNHTPPLSNFEEDSATNNGNNDIPNGDSENHKIRPQASTSSVQSEHDQNGGEDNTFTCTSVTHTESDLCDAIREQLDVQKSDASSPSGSEPIYEGEDRILDSAATSYESREPVYEGEVVLAEQAERGAVELHPQCDNSQQNGELIRNFLRSNASQLTIYGLFCLQEGLKERELCVFFRNNHFSTMFKLNGELYLLATDQGYINQPDLVWEKLNEVNGDTVFMTGNFTEFKVDDHANDTWNQQNAVASTADYLASIDNSTPADSSFNSDLQLAIALQQQEFDNQPQRNQSSQGPSSGGHSRLVTGPQVQRTNPSRPSPKPESKKDKCTVM